MIHLLPLIVILPLIVFWMWMFQEMMNNRYLTGNDRLNWTLAFLFMNVFGAIMYYFTEYRNR